MSKRITLPSGGSCLVRKISQRDYIASGLMPVILRLSKMTETDVRKKASEEEEAKAIEHLTRMVEVKLFNCVGKISYPDGRTVRIVDKRFDDCKDDEISIDEVSQADAAAIVEAVDELSGLRKEAAAAASKFRQGPADGSGDSPAGDVLQRPADD